MKYVDYGEMSFDQIGAELGISGSYARLLYVRAIKKVAKACARYGLSPADIVGRPRHAIDRLGDF